VEYLGWWVKGAPLAVPLVSTGPISTTHHGWLSSPDSTILDGAPQAPAQGGNDTSRPRFSPGPGCDGSPAYALGFVIKRFARAWPPYVVSCPLLLALRQPIPATASQAA
jgi:hypothetical protein